jgi:hypothetical protein
MQGLECRIPHNGGSKGAGFRIMQGLECRIPDNAGSRVQDSG